MNNIKISNLQFILTTSGFVFGSGPLFIAHSLAVVAGNDGWISAILATIIGLLTVFINTYLRSLYPEKTLVETIQLLLGKWFGSIVSIIFSFLALVVGTQIIWYVGDFITTTYMPEVSPYPINILFIVSIVVALLYGLEVIFRAVAIYFYFLFPLYIITLIMLFPNINIDNLLPFFENGLLPVIKGTIPFLSLAVWPMIVLNMVTLSNFSDPKKAKNSMLYGYLLGMFTAFVGALMCILVLGDTITASLRYPLFILNKEINVGTIFTRFEAVVVAVWLTTNFISTFFFIYGGVKGLSQVLKLTDYKKIVIPVALIVAVYSQIIYKSVPYHMRWDTDTWPLVSFTMGFILPVILLLVSVAKRLFTKSMS